VGTESRTLIARFDGSTTGLNRAVTRAEGKLRGFRTHAERTSTSGGKLGSSFGTAAGKLAKFGRVAGGAGVALGALTLGASGVVAGLLKIGDEAVASTLGVAKARTVFGESFAEFERWTTRAANAMGLTKFEAYALGSGFASTARAAGFTATESAKYAETALTLAGRLSTLSLGQYDTAESTELIAAAIRGEYDSLQNILPSISAAKIEEEAVAIRKRSGNKMSIEKARLLAIEKIVTEGSTGATTLANTAEGKRAETIRTTKARFRELWGELQTKLLPIVERLYQWFSEKLLPKLQEFVTWLGSKEGQAKIKEWGERVVTAASAAARLASAVASAVAWITELNTKMDEQKNKSFGTKLKEWTGADSYFDAGAHWAPVGGMSRTGGPAYAAASTVNVDSRVYLDGQLIAATARAVVNDSASRQAWRARTGRR